MVNGAVECLESRQLTVQLTIWSAMCSECREVTVSLALSAEKKAAASCDLWSLASSGRGVTSSPALL